MLKQLFKNIFCYFTFSTCDHVGLVQPTKWYMDICTKCGAVLGDTQPTGDSRYIVVKSPEHEMTGEEIDQAINKTWG